jgi:hypothetical protein
MNRQSFASSLVLIFGFAMLGCRLETASNVTTPIIPPAAEAEDESAATDIKITPTVTPIGWIPSDDVGYYEGIVAITQYYTLLGHGFYEEAFQLLSMSTQQRNSGLQDFVERGEEWYQKVEIVQILPHRVYVRELGAIPRLYETIQHRIFRVQIRAWGKGNMSGAVMSGDLQTIHLDVILEGDEWKIDY